MQLKILSDNEYEHNKFDIRYKLMNLRLQKCFGISKLYFVHMFSTNPYEVCFIYNLCN